MFVYEKVLKFDFENNQCLVKWKNTTLSVFEADKCLSSYEESVNDYEIIDGKIIIIEWKNTWEPLTIDFMKSYTEAKEIEYNLKRN